MEVYDSLEHIKSMVQPVALSIGTFDGLHLGHLSVVQHLKTLAKKENIPSVIITFRNHPSVILRPHNPIPLILTPEHKLRLFEEQGIDLVIILNFNLSLSQQTAKFFLSMMHTLLPFRYLILGHDAKLGCDRQTDGPFLRHVADELHFLIETVSPVLSYNQPISSSRIRQALQQVDLEEVTHQLGRKYSIYSQVLAGQGRGKRLGYPTANIILTGYCTPPFGVYIVFIKTRFGDFPAVANLGMAPTVRHDHVVLLETHLLNASQNLYNEWIEVVFEQFLRPERVFENIEALKTQIASDIKQAKEFYRL